MARSSTILVIIALLLAGCAGVESTPVQVGPAVQPGQSTLTAVTLPTSVAVMESATPAPKTAAGPTPESAAGICPAFAPGPSCPTPTAEPAAQPTLPSPTATNSAPAQDQTSAFKDCARTPGLATCDPQAGAVPGELAFVDAQASRLVVLNLKTGSGWQIPAPVQEGQVQVQQVDWSPKGDQLLVGTGQNQYFVYSPTGQQLSTFTQEGTPVQWQPDNRLSKDGTVDSADGSTALVTQGPDTSWNLKIVKAGGGEQTVPVSPATDQIYQLRAWVPGQDKLLAQRYYASNSAMLVGGALILIDPANGAIQDLNATAPLAARGVFAWNPKTPTLLAFRQSGGKDMMLRTIGLLDFSTGQLRNPLPDTVSVSDLAWTLDGERLLFSAQPVEGAPTEVTKTFPGPGIYVLNLQTGAVTRVLETPSGAQDGFLNLAGDGDTLIYARVLPSNGTNTSVELHARSLGQPDAPDRILVNGLVTDRSSIDDQFWSYFLAFAPLGPGD